MSLHFCYSTTALETYFLSKLRDFLLYCPKRLQGFCLPYFELEISRLYQFQTERSKLAYHLNSSAFITFAKHIERIFQRKKIEQTHKSQRLRYQIKCDITYILIFFKAIYILDTTYIFKGKNQCEFKKLKILTPKISSCFKTNKREKFDLQSKLERIKLSMKS